MRVRSTPAAQSGRRSDSIATSPTGPSTTRMRRRTDFDSNEDLEEFLAKAFAGRGQRHRVRFGRAARM